MPVQTAALHVLAGAPATRPALPCLQAYTACDPGSDHRGILSRIVEGLGLAGVSERAVQHPEPRSALMAVLRAWLPLAEAVLQMAVDHLPSPLVSRPGRRWKGSPPGLHPGGRECCSWK